MLFAVLVLTFLVAIPNAQTPVALLDGIALLSARRAQRLGWGPVVHGGFGFTVFLLLLYLCLRCFGAIEGKVRSSI